MVENGETAVRGEDLACERLEAAGWEIVERNWTRNIGELDIIVSRRETWGNEDVTIIAFVEVKTREKSRGPLPEQRVNDAKRRKLVTLGKLYLAETRRSRVMARFDVIGVDLDTETVRHHRSAFDGSGCLR